MCDFLQSVTTGFTPLSPEDTFFIPRRYLPTSSAAQKYPILYYGLKQTKMSTQTKYQTGFYMSTRLHLLLLCICDLQLQPEGRNCTTDMEMRRHKTSTQNTTTEAHSQRPAANIIHAVIVQVLGATHLRLDNGHRRRPS